MQAPVRRDVDGRKMYPGRFWEWPEGVPGDLDQPDARMEYGIALWTNTEETMPSVRQLSFLLSLLDTREGEPSEIDWASKRQVARVINWLTKQPLKARHA